MSDDEFYRIKRLPPYVIAEVNAMRAAARAAGEDIIDLGMGNPDLPPPQHVIDKLCEVAQKPDAHGYSQSKGIPGLRRAQANYYARRFNVELDPESEVVVTMGSKEGLASLATAITGPGDVVLAPNPSYPIHTFGFIIAGATIRSVPTTPDENYWRALDRAMAFTVPRPSILVVNYPSNPTAEAVDLAFYERLVAWAKENKVWVLSDLAYSELYYDGNPTPSILQVPGAKDVARRDGRKLRARRLGYSEPARVDVRLGAAAARAQGDGQPRILQAASDPCQGRGCPRRRLWRGRRGLCPHRDGRKRAAHPSGGAQRPQIPPDAWCEHAVGRGRIGAMFEGAPTIAQTIQLSVAPVFLLVAMGNLLNVFTGRLARVIDRSRKLTERHATTTGVEHSRLVEELRVIARRMRVINTAILFAVCGGLVVCILVSLLFLQYAAGFHLGVAVSLVFVLAMLFLLLSLGMFLYEVRLATHAILIPTEFLERN
jgi:hypothetical protein